MQIIAVGMPLESRRHSGLRRLFGKRQGDNRDTEYQQCHGGLKTGIGMYFSQDR